MKIAHFHLCRDFFTWLFTLLMLFTHCCDVIFSFFLLHLFRSNVITALKISIEIFASLLYLILTSAILWIAEYYGKLKIECESGKKPIFMNLHITVLLLSAYIWLVYIYMYFGLRFSSISCKRLIQIFVIYNVYSLFLLSLLLVSSDLLHMHSSFNAQAIAVSFLSSVVHTFDDNTARINVEKKKKQQIYWKIKRKMIQPNSVVNIHRFSLMDALFGKWCGTHTALYFSFIFRAAPYLITRT